MQFIFSTGSLYNYSIDRCFELASRAGFDGVELMIDHRWDTRQAGYVERLTRRYQIPVRAVHSPFPRNITGWAADYPGAIQKSVEMAEALQAPVVILHLPERVSYTVLQLGSRRLLLPLPGVKRHEAYIRWLLEGMPKLQQSTPVLLCIENLPAVNFWGKKLNPARWNAYNRETIGDITRFPHITLDTTHLGTWGLDPAEVVVRWGRRVKHVHLSNFNGREHRRPEDGHLRLDRFLERLAEAGYNHAVSLELHPDALDAGADDGRIIELLTHSLACCRQWSAGSARSWSADPGHAQ
jgi:sugar phosphate isomerase/epimerase